MRSRSTARAPDGAASSTRRSPIQGWTISATARTAATVPAADSVMALTAPTGSSSGIRRSGAASPAPGPPAGGAAPARMRRAAPGAPTSEITNPEPVPSHSRDEGVVSWERTTPDAAPNRSPASPVLRLVSRSRCPSAWTRASW